MAEAADDDHDAPECLEVGIISHDGTTRVTFHQDEAAVINEGDEEEGDGRESRTTRVNLPPRKNSFVDRTAQWPRSLSERQRDFHMKSLIRDRMQSMVRLVPMPNNATDDSDVAITTSMTTSTALEDRESMEMHSAFVRHLKKFLEEIPQHDNNLNYRPEMEVRLKNVSYKVPSLNDGPSNNKIRTIYNTSPLYKFQRCIRWLRECKKRSYLTPSEKEKKKYLVSNVLSNINLNFKPKCMYLVLGPPLSGKTSLLKAISGTLHQGTFSSGYSEKKFLTGQILFNNLVCSGDGADSSLTTLFKNLVAFIRQTDCHAPRLTVGETLLFAGMCKDEALRKNKKGKSMDGKVGLILEGLGLAHAVQDTFVGNEQIRGVSGGQRRRVTLGEMLVFDTPLLCCDEISTGEYLILSRETLI